MSVASTEAESHVVPPAASGSWRTWLVTGARQEPIQRRRVRGAHKELKRLLVEGMSDDGDLTHRWKSFSGAMVRQAVEEVVSSLPPRQKQLIKLAYFSDLSNREIAQGLGITLSSVERGLRQAVSRVSEYVERGRSAGRRGIYALAMFVGGRWLTEAANQTSARSAAQLVKAGALIIATATAGAVLATQPAPPAQLAYVESGSVPTISSAQPFAVLQRHAVDIPKVDTAIAERDKSQAISEAANAGGVQVAPPGVTVPAVTLPPVTLPPVPLPIPVKLPPFPPARILHELLGA
jgi:RNA polymerase sigma factor (sigma-70 family)